MPPAKVDLVYSTKFGKAYRGDAKRALGRTSPIVPAGSVDLIFTSPPFALARPKDYGNRSQSEYVKWFRTFLPAFKRALSPTGSLVIDIGGAWLPGSPQRSTYHFALALLLEEQFQFCQEFYWYNPAKLPSPAEWVTRRRWRVKVANEGKQRPGQEALLDFDDESPKKRLPGPAAAFESPDQCKLPNG